MLHAGVKWLKGRLLYSRGVNEENVVILFRTIEEDDCSVFLALGMI